MSNRQRYIRFFSTIGMGDVSDVGGKNASLGEMYRELTMAGLLVPNGFAVTTAAYTETLDHANVWPELHRVLDGVRVDDVSDLAARAAHARELVAAADLPAEIRAAITDAHARLANEYGSGLSVAVRSSATAEDMPTASFAGQHETYLNVQGERQVLDAVRRCFASLFTDRAIRYRVDRGIDHFKVFNSVCVMKMVRSDVGAAGVIFSIDTETGFRDAVFITGSYGLGENVVQGAVDPDEFYVFKPTFKLGKRVVLRRTLGAKKIKMIYALGGSRDRTRNVPTDRKERERFCLTDEEVLTLAGQTIRIEEHYSVRAGASRPMDIEWAKDGLDGRLYILQARPETVASQASSTTLEQYVLKGKGEVRVAGRAVGARVASGAARVVSHVSDLASLEAGEVLIVDTTTPDWGPVMKRAAAIVTNRGGRTCHAAIVARELGIPAIVGTDTATRAIRSGETITVSCAEGDVGKVYTGAVPFEIEHTVLSMLPRPATHMMVNIGEPDRAFATSFLPNDGVGLARMEYIIAGAIKAHPMALVHPERVEDPQERKAIEALAANDSTPAAFFVRALAEGVGMIAAAFYPKPVIVRMSDFKTNEYASLIGGRVFEPEEENPMLGFRGASRYTHPAYAEGFALECAP